MSKPHKKPGNPDFAHRVSPPAPPNEAIEARLRDLLTPGTFANLMAAHPISETSPAWRNRLLTLPVMTAIVLSLVYRQVNHLSDVLRLLADEGLLWVPPLTVTKQALSQRLNRLPAEWFRQMFEEVASRLRQAADHQELSRQQRELCQRFAAVWLADGSTLERLQRKLAVLRSEPTAPLAGKLMMVVTAFSHRPVAAWYRRDPQTHDQQWQEQLLELLPVNGLLVFDLGFFEYAWFERLTSAQRWFVTRQRPTAKVQVVRSLARQPTYRDEQVQLGSSPRCRCSVPLRRVSVLWAGKWYHYLTNVLDPTQLSAAEVAQLYRARWQIETAFKLIKRLLGLSSLWVGHANGVQIQLYATLLFYAVLMDLCGEVAGALGRPRQDISEEMVFRSLYFYSRARERQPQEQLLPYLLERVQRLGLVKARRASHRRSDALHAHIWGHLEPALGLDKHTSALT